MSKAKRQRSEPPPLHERAEKLAQISSTDISKMTSSDVQHLVHELQVHQIELQLQNEELLAAQVQLADSRDRYSDLYNFAPIGYVTVDAKGKILECNLTAARMLRVGRRTLLGANLSTFVGRDSLREWYVHRRAAFSTGKKHACEINMRRPDGTHLAVRVEGVVSGSNCRTALIDITERKDAEQARDALNQRLEQRVREQTEQIRLHAEAVAHAPDGVMIAVGPDWSQSTILFVNEAMCRISGYTAAGLTGRPRSILNGKQTDRKTLNRIQRELAAGNFCRAELIQYRKDGTPYDAELSITPVSEPSGRIANFVSIHRDISERKRTEQELVRYRNGLRTMATELMLAEERERQRLAEDLHDGLGQALFRARMKFDQLSIAGPDAAEVVAILEEMGRMMNTLTFQLSPPVLRKLGLRHALKSLAKDMQLWYALSVDVDTDEQDLPLDERAGLVLFRSVRELLINVAKHAQTDRATLSIRRQEHSLQIKVEDRGKGFNLADHSLHVESGHFGLFSIRERLEYIGGSFKIRSAPRDGTTVTLTAPLVMKNARDGA